MSNGIVLQGVDSPLKRASNNWKVYPLTKLLADILDAMFNGVGLQGVDSPLKKSQI